jgi:hypothetical protein
MLGRFFLPVGYIRQQVRFFRIRRAGINQLQRACAPGKQ